MSNALSAWTTFGIGGPARRIVVANDVSELAGYAASGALVLGGGSNVLVSDDGIDREVAINRCQGIAINGEIVTVLSGERLPQLCAYLAEAGLSGMEWACGIPGSAGGALVMNAGAFSRSMSDVAVGAEIVRGGKRIYLDRDELGLSYRASAIMPTDTVLSVTIELDRAAPALVKARCKRFAAERRAKQPTGKTAGSIFKNPDGISVGRVLDEAGLKGTRIGGAIISPVHANIIVNTGGATARDVTALIGIMRRALADAGVDAQEEIKYIGEF